MKGQWQKKAAASRCGMWEQVAGGGRRWQLLCEAEMGKVDDVACCSNPMALPTADAVAKYGVLVWLVLACLGMNGVDSKLPVSQTNAAKVDGPEGAEGET